MPGAIVYSYIKDFAVTLAGLACPAPGQLPALLMTIFSCCTFLYKAFPGQLSGSKLAHLILPTADWYLGLVVNSGQPKVSMARRGTWV